MSEPSNENQTGEVTDAQQEAAEHVVERAESWDEGAEPKTVRDDLKEGMDQAGVPVEEAELDRMAKEIHDEGETEAPTVK